MKSSIPAPTDSYDHETSFLANVTSIKAMLLAFDAQMDALNECIDQQLTRMDRLETRCDRIDHKIESVWKESQDCPIRIRCPATYSHGNENQQPLYQESPITKAVRASTEAIHSVLKEDALRSLNSPPAKLSDEWLDQVRGFDEGNVCRQAIQMNTVPPLRIQNSVKQIKSSDGIYAEEVKYYRNGLIKEALMGKEVAARVKNDEISILSEGMGTTCTNYSTISTGPAATRRRRRKMAAIAMKKVSEGGDSEPNRIEGGQNVFIRQNFMNGGLAYACEAVHDLYGNTNYQ